MNETPNTEVTFSEILGAISLRVIWAIIKRALLAIVAYGIFGGIGLIIGEAVGFKEEWDPAWRSIVFIAMGWAFVYVTTSSKSFHWSEHKWYFPRTNIFSSLLMSVYAVLSITAITSLPKGYESGILFVFLYGFPIFIYYTLNCGYYLVMTKRYPNYQYEDFSISMPGVLFDLSMKPGGISGGANEEYDF